MRRTFQAPLPAAAGLILACASFISCGGREIPSKPAAPVVPGIRYEANLVAGDVAPIGIELRNPHSGDAAVAKAGGAMFAAMNCDGCHGGDASGYVGPSLTDGRWRFGGSDAEVFSSIYYGRAKGMPAFGGALGSEGVWVLVTYLKSLPVPPGEATESWESQ
jgi:mono/diheme cytochrome c family protein